MPSRPESSLDCSERSCHPMVRLILIWINTKIRCSVCALSHVTGIFCQPATFPGRRDSSIRCRLMMLSYSAAPSGGCRRGNLDHGALVRYRTQAPGTACGHQRVPPHRSGFPTGEVIIGCRVIDG